jgi:hypothetical protein
LTGLRINRGAAVRAGSVVEGPATSHTQLYETGGKWRGRNDFELHPPRKVNLTLPRSSVRCTITADATL